MHSVDYLSRIQEPDEHVMKSPIRKKEGAWIGAHSLILKGVTIGKHSIVGAGSVVTRDIPDDEVWAGNPVRFIKKILTRRICCCKKNSKKGENIPSIWISHSNWSRW